MIRRTPESVKTDNRARRNRAPTAAPWGIAFDLGLRLGLAVVIGVLAGLVLDSMLSTRPLFILVGAALGVAAAMGTIWQVARRSMRS